MSYPNVRPVLWPELSRFLHQRAKGPRRTLLLEAYIDDSGYMDTSVIVIGGLIASENAIRLMEARWRKILGKYDLPEIHAKDLPRVMRDWPREKRDTAMSEITSAITAVRPRVFGGGMVLGDFEKTCSKFTWFRQWANREPMTFCFHSAIQSAVNLAKGQSPEESVAIMMDNPGRLEGMASRARDAYLEAARWNPFVKSVAFGTRLEVLPLQSADFVAHEMFLDFKRWLAKDDRPRRIPLRRLITETDSDNCFIHVGPEFMADIAKLLIQQAKERGATLI